jgi:hypothetical protein
MKLQHLALVLISIVSTSAFASKARLQALGQNENGSYYLKDNRNIFLNPAFLNDTADFANFEWGATTRPDSNPNAEGGFIQTHNDMKYGIQLGRETQMETNVGYANGLGGTTGLAAPEDTLELLIGGNAGMKWGGSFTYQRSKNDVDAYPKDESSGYELRGGVSQDKFDAYARLNLFNDSKHETAAGTDDKLEGTFGLRAGGSYRLAADQTLYGELNWEDFENKDTPETYKYDITGQGVTVGYARTIAKEGNTTFFHSIAFAWEKNEAKEKVGGTSQKTESFYFPLTIGVESDATNWMVLRGSVSQNVLIAQTKAGDDKTENYPNSTTVAAGTGFKFNAFTVDATFAGSSNGQINAVNFLSNVGMTYNF